MLKHGLQYLLGVVTKDKIPFYPSGSCRPGGIYFTDLKHAWQFVEYGTLMVDVEIPQDAKVYRDPDNDVVKWKASELILKNLRPIPREILKEALVRDRRSFIGINDAHVKLILEDFSYDYLFRQVYRCEVPMCYIWQQTEEMCFATIQYDANALAYVLNKTPKLCREAISRDPYTIRFLEDQPEDLCWLALNKASDAIRYIYRPTEEMCMQVIRKDPNNLQFIINQTTAVCQAAIAMDSRTIHHVHDQTEALCLQAVSKHGLTLQHITNPTHAVCVAALQIDGYAIKYIKHQSKEYIRMAVSQNPWAIYHCNNFLLDPSMLMLAIDGISPQDIPANYQLVDYIISLDPTKTVVLLYTLSKNGLYLQYVNEFAQTREVIKAALDSNLRAFQYVKNPTRSLCLNVVFYNGMLLQYISSQDEKICLTAVSNYGVALQFVKKQNEQICLAAVKENGNALQYVNEQTDAICLAAVRRDGCALQFVKHQTAEIVDAALKQDPRACYHIKV